MTNSRDSAAQPITVIAMLAIALAIASPGCVSSRHDASFAAGGVLLGTYFLDNGQDGVYLCISEDGDTFRPIVEPNVPILRPAVGKEKLIRDACILWGPDKQWHMVWTVGWWDGGGIGLAHSSDLLNWSEQDLVPVMAHEPGTLNCWAPEIAWDDRRGQYLIFWSSTVRGRFPETEAGGDPGPTPDVKCNHRIYQTTTRDFKTYSHTTLMYNPGFECIDATLLRRLEPTPWLMFIKDETRYPPAKNIRAVDVADPVLIQAEPSKPLTGGYWAEGPSAIHLSGRVRVYFDRYADNRFGAVETNELGEWVDISDRISFPKGARHTTVVWADRTFTESVTAGLRARLQSSATP